MRGLGSFPLIHRSLDVGCWKKGALQLKKSLRGLTVDSFLPAAEIIHLQILKGNSCSKYKQPPHNPSSGAKYTCCINPQVSLSTEKCPWGLCALSSAHSQEQGTLTSREPVPSPEAEPNIIIISLWLSHMAVGRRPQFPTTWASP